MWWQTSGAWAWKNNLPLFIHHHKKKGSEGPMSLS